jgi:hypothetical protein
MKRKYSRVFVVFGCAFIAFLPRTQAVSPEPDGCYPNYTTAEGCNALQFLGTGAGNTGIGWHSLYSVGDVNYNTAVGAGTLAFDSNGNSNTAVGAAALLVNYSGTQNVAVGVDALLFNNEGDFNNAVGAVALFNNADGSFNNAFGWGALGANVSGSSNTAIGDSALASDNGNDEGIGNENTAVGVSALFSNVTGSFNTAMGGGALGGCTTGSSNVAIGDGAGNAVVSGSNIICIGANVAGEDVSGTTWVGNVYGVTTQSGITAPVVVSDGGQLGTVASSERFKKDILNMDESSEAIMSLRPVTFHYKTDTKGTPQFGLIAEEVAKVNPALVLPDKEGKPYTVRYEAVNAMLLNEFLKEHKAFVEEQHKVEQLQAIVANLLITVKEQTAQIQKVSRELEMNRAASEVAANGQ